MIPPIARFIKNESGTTAIEYGLIAIGVAVAILSAVQLLGSNVLVLYETVGGALASLP